MNVVEDARFRSRNHAAAWLAGHVLWQVALLLFAVSLAAHMNPTWLLAGAVVMLVAAVGEVASGAKGTGLLSRRRTQLFRGAVQTLGWRPSRLTTITNAVVTYGLLGFFVVVGVLRLVNP